VGLVGFILALYFVTNLFLGFLLNIYFNLVQTLCLNFTGSSVPFAFIMSLLLCGVRKVMEVAGK